MKLLCVVSTLNFPQFTRRATIEAIWRQNLETELLMFTGLKTFRKEPVSILGLKTYLYRFWTPEQLKTMPLISCAEHILRKKRWADFMNRYEAIFLTDPNQYWLLPYIRKQKIIYLIRDPNVLQSEKNFPREKAIFDRADVVFATSRNLAEKYLSKYYGFQHSNIHYWPNTVDLNIWDYNFFKDKSVSGKKFIAGMAGNINDRTDINLLEHITNDEDILFELCGKVTDKVRSNPVFQEVISRKNVKHLGYIPFHKLPERVWGWNVGLTIEKKCEYTRFTHHNKVYQYLALGKPVVILKIHNDYDDLGEPIFVCDTKEEYAQNLKELMSSEKKETEWVEDALRIANENSNEVRAKQFLNTIGE